MRNPWFCAKFTDLNEKLPYLDDKSVVLGINSKV